MGHAVKLRGARSCGSAFEGDSTPGCHATCMGDSTPASAATVGNVEWLQSTGWEMQRRTPVMIQRSSTVSAVTNMNSEQWRVVCQRPAREGRGQ